MKTFSALAYDLGVGLKRMRANINKSVFVGREIIRSAFSPKPGLNILFSVKPAWEPNIRIGFRPTKHHLLFDAFTDDNIEKSDLAVPLTMKDLKYLSSRRPYVFEINPRFGGSLSPFFFSFVRKLS